MATFSYKAKSTNQGVVRGTIEAENQAQAAVKLKATGFYPLSLEKAESSPQKFRFISARSIKKQDISMMTRELSDLVKAGLQLVEALDLIKSQLKKGRLRFIISDLQDQIKQGASLSHSLTRFPETFSSFYINLVKSGELAGVLDHTLERIADTLEKEDDLRSKVRAAMAYPTLIAAVGVITVFSLLTFVIPKLNVMFEDLGQALPITTRILMGISFSLSHYWWAVLAGAGLLALLTYKLNKNPAAGYWMDKLQLSTPLIAPLKLKITIFNLSRSLGTLLKHGVPILDALKATAKSMENKIVMKECDKLIKDIQEGKSLGEAMSQLSLFPEAFGHMIQVGERTGKLDDRLLRAAEIFERQVDQQLKIVTSLLEPLMIVGIGSVLGIMVIGMLLPIFKMNIFVH